jgi:hypothetical protein
MGKQKGRFRKGKYIEPEFGIHIKAKRIQEGPSLTLTIRLGEDDVERHLKPQIERFLKEVKKQKRTKQVAD